MFAIRAPGCFFDRLLPFFFRDILFFSTVDDATVYDTVWS